MTKNYISYLQNYKSNFFLVLQEYAGSSIKHSDLIVTVMKAIFQKPTLIFQVVWSFASFCVIVVVCLTNTGKYFALYSLHIESIFIEIY